MAAPIFKHLRIGGWRQFAAVELHFHDRLTVITGANGAGKSTILNLLSSHLGVSRPYLGVPRKAEGRIQFLSGLFSFASRRVSGWLSKAREQDSSTVGNIGYSNGYSAAITVPRESGLTYSPGINGQQPVLGFHMPSHRLLPQYQQVPSLPFGGVRPAEAFQRLIAETYSSYVGGHTGSSLLFQLKSVLASWAAFGLGNDILDAEPEQVAAFRGFIKVLRTVLPPELGFQDIKVQAPDLLLQTRSGTFLIDAASGGIITLIEVSALIYACTLREDIQGRRFVVTFDEPENHLHPALQRTIFPSLVRAFPQVQFIVATHSPFIVSSLRDSKVYVLRYTPTKVELDDPKWHLPNSRRVESSPLDHVSRAGSANEILREVLGVPVTFPAWVESELEQLVARYDRRPLTEATIAELRADVAKAGLEEFFSEALIKLGRHE